MFNVRLLFRLYRSGGMATALRVALMTLGVSLVVIAVLAAASVAGGVASLTERANTRFPVPAASGDGTFRVTVASDFLGTTPMRIVRVAAVPNTSPPPPPGCDRFPQPGQSCVSPTLAGAFPDHPVLAAKLGTGIRQVIAESGLADGTELIAYVGTSYNSAEGSAAIGWGPTNGSAPPLVPTAFVILVLLLLVGLPGSIFLAVCGRLSASVRARRIRVLRMLGAPRRTVSLVTASDGILAGVAAAALALVAWVWVEPWFARSGLSGFEWFPSATPITPISIALVVIGAPLVTGWLASVGNGRSRRESVVRKAPRPATKLRFVVLWLGVVASGWYFWDSHQTTTHPKAWLFLLSAALLVTGVLIAARPIVEALSAVMAPRVENAVLRLAWRRLEMDSSAVIRVVSGAAVFVLVATVGLAVSRDVELTVSDPGPSLVLTVATDSTTTSVQRDGILRLPADSVQATVPYASAQAGDAGATPEFATAMYANCATIAHVLGHPVPACRDGQEYRVEDKADGLAPAVAAGTRLYDQADESITYTSPAAVIDLGGGVVGLLDLLITTGETPPPGATYHFTIANTNAAILTLQDRLASVAPNLVAEPSIDIDAIQGFHAIRSIIKITAALGFILGLAAMMIAVADRAAERRREVAHLTAIGVAVKTVRRSQMVQLGIAATVCLGTTVIVGQIVAQAYLALGGDQKGWYWPTLGAGVSLAVIGTLVCIVGGLVVFGRRLSYELLAAT